MLRCRDGQKNAVHPTRAGFSIGKIDIQLNDAEYVDYPMNKIAVCLVCLIFLASSLFSHASVAQTPTASGDEVVKQFLEKKKLTFTDKGQTKKLNDYLAVAEEKCVFTFLDETKTYKAQLSVTCQSDRLPIKALLSANEKTHFLLAVEPKEIRKETKEIELTFSPPPDFQPEGGYRLYLFRKESKSQESDYLYTDLPVTFFSRTFNPGKSLIGLSISSVQEATELVILGTPPTPAEETSRPQSDTPEQILSTHLIEALYSIPIEINSIPARTNRIRLGKRDDSLSLTYALPSGIFDSHPVRLALETVTMHQFLDIPLVRSNDKPIVIQTPEPDTFYLRLYYAEDESLARQVAVIVSDSASIWIVIGYTVLSCGAILSIFFIFYYYLPDFTKTYLPLLGKLNVLPRIAQMENDTVKLRSAYRDLSSQAASHEKILRRVLQLPTIREELSGNSAETRISPKSQRTQTKTGSPEEESPIHPVEKTAPEAKKQKYTDLFSPYKSPKPAAAAMNSTSFFMQSVVDYLNERIARVEQWNNSEKNEFVDALEEKFATRVYHLEPPSASGQSHQGPQETIALEKTSGFANFIGFLAKERFLFIPVPWIDLYDPKKRTRVRNFYTLQEEESIQSLTFYALPELTLISPPDEGEWTVRRIKAGSLALPSFAKFLDPLPQ